ncbi:glycosyltransferase [Pimelobacter sp. 30-1]|uniref:glycosyltransferase n=1 Tax=Pimelobacter sp. 30-1 TaxID=2004991 RepID=UPI001C04059B|nr:glycosyltransferase [Pimelobacter sp. 30-1]MBU2693790.1 glycosyl transferase family 1 [Pimelobacter sp. 30-1]
MSPRAWGRLRFAASWLVALGLVVVVVPRAVNVSWTGVLPVLLAIPVPAVLGLAGLWLLGLYVHSFVLTAAAPSLTHRRALTLNVTGSAVANVIPLGGAAGVELNRRMMKAWGINTRSFTGYTLLTNLWDIGAKLLLPLVGVLALTRAGEAVLPPLRDAALIASGGFVLLVAAAGVLLATSRGAGLMGGALHDVRRECTALIARGWMRMSLGITGYVALQCLLLGLCLHLTGAGTTPADVIAGFAVERLVTIVPVTPGGIGLADLGLAGVLLALGGDPAGVAAAIVLYRLFVFAVEIPVGGGALGLWLLGQRRSARRSATPGLELRSGPVRRVAHVTDVFLPRLGGIETHVDDLARHQRAAGLDAEVLTPPVPGAVADPPWVRRAPVREARRAVREGRYDAVHVHVSLFSPYGLGVARAAAAAGVPTLVTVHSLWTGAGGVVRLAALAWLRRWPVAWSAVSEAAAQVCRRALGGAEVAVLPNAIDVDRWRPGPAALGGAADHPVVIVSVMRLMPRKRPLQLLKMFREVRRLTPGRDVRLVVVGDGPLWGRADRYVRRHGLSDCVTITGRVSRRDVRDVLRTASLYVAPAPRESFGIAALEARCAGLPVVAHRGSGVTEFVRDRVDGLLVHDDAEMAVALADLVQDDGMRARMAAHNRRVAPPLDWSDVLERTSTLYGAAVVPVAVGA